MSGVGVRRVMKRGYVGLEPFQGLRILDRISMRPPTPIRLERFMLGVPIHLLSMVSGISVGRLSMAETGQVELSEEEDDRRKLALEEIEEKLIRERRAR